MVTDRPLIGLVEENLSANVCRLNVLQYHYLVVKYEQYKTNVIFLRRYYMH